MLVGLSVGSLDYVQFGRERWQLGRLGRFEIGEDNQSVTTQSLNSQPWPPRTSHPPKSAVNQVNAITLAIRRGRPPTLWIE